MQNNNVTFGVMFDCSTYADCGNKIYVMLCYVRLSYRLLTDVYQNLMSDLCLDNMCTTRHVAILKKIVSC